ncbi:MULTISPECIES: Dam family site-specific DNA-(adenine-N6)-methyltransferase [Alteromonadaceae]|uniref:Dam family site-specific DNA-(adenine-N6)-methyltransferase n=1 Tax=Alteromonadaceae TaxID=72275 RepID=UPI001C08EBB4|nr:MULTISPECIES: Dam family site-specific DNA-(adenine-N6)-methyltransferase [Aliiglaciecola]MBU2878534.1 Dam family site-specific DNA-(adenine-N6)-methyltransferase [Aliiglaciecola lipolytica]MDO6709638.1 Dam family site-specific DNA-(adenine-N6)-methyltransferase [Aliiglaciecola sp. 2_MG-2023]MDO6750820.1 Dam family site-specific DNA-(adenine-N6)-methyltransferase [Aliiglaciecola sp. 1_MG-2023]
MKKNKNRAFLKWAGGKYGLIDEICQRLPQGNKLIEPFVGAGSVFLNTEYPQYVLNDINPDLINLYSIIKTQAEYFIKESEKLFSPSNNQEKRFYELRKEFNHSDDLFFKSILFLYLNRHGYNGLCRYNLSGGFNVPFGRYKAPYFPKKELYYFAEKSQKATFTCEPFQHTFARARSGNVIYSDPPYAPISLTANFTQYSKNGFSLDEQLLLAKLAKHNAKKKSVSVLISNHDTPFTREIYSQADITSLMVKRTISQKGDKRVKVGELLALYT